jgi:hypothetical protein
MSFILFVCHSMDKIYKTFAVPREERGNESPKVSKDGNHLSKV